MIVKCCAISDTHSRHWKLVVEDCDILLHAGDISGNGKKNEVEDFISWYEDQNALYKIWIAGNHERGFEKKADWLLERLANLKNNTYYLEDTGINIMGINIWGTPWQPEFCNWEFNLPRGGELKEKYDLIPPNTDILLSHGPPFGIDDYIPWEFVRPFEKDNRVGCRDLYNRLKELELKFHIFGHIHLDDRDQIRARPVTTKRDSTLCINASVVDNKYQLYAKPYYFNYEL